MKRWVYLMVGTGRFELPTPRTPSECSTRLSHVPTRKDSTGATVALRQPVTLQQRGSLNNSTLLPAQSPPCHPEQSEGPKTRWTQDDKASGPTPGLSSSDPRPCPPGAVRPARVLSPCAPAPAVA